MHKWRCAGAVYLRRRVLLLCDNLRVVLGHGGVV